MRALPAALVCLILIGCGGDAAEVAVPAASPTHERSALTVGFLQGGLAFEELEIAPVVSLHLALDGTRVQVPRDELRSLASWKVRSQTAGAIYSFVPPEDATGLKLREGRHLNCLEYDLASRPGNLGDLPHVGATMTSGEGTSCLESWNVTFLFEPAAESPTLIGAVYDQWEW
ncbi:MAG TPA: hypothetical protein VEU28_10600 [Actinomycetota bacterium]|nr:hypothetical protein [Actinomycetota bacterium]